MRPAQDALAPPPVRYGRVANGIVLVVAAVLVFGLLAFIGNAYGTSAAPPDWAPRATGFALVPLLVVLVGGWMVIRSHRAGRVVLGTAAAATPVFFLMVGGVFETVESPLALSIAAATLLLAIVLAQGSLARWKRRHRPREAPPGA